MPAHSLDLALQLGLFAVSLLANLLSALAGGGAGLVQLPALILLGLPFSLALATHKLASVALGVGATVRHLQGESLKPQLTAVILLSGLPGVWLGARWVLQLPPRLSVLMLGLLTIALGCYSFARPQLGAVARPRALSLRQHAIGAAGCLPSGCSTVRSPRAPVCS
jgi:uncharacterized membrane protein YfcA